MPLHFADGSIDVKTLQTVPEDFIIFYSSVVDGQMWCPDCRAVDHLVQQVFSDDGPDALIVYVGDRGQWKTPSNIYRQAPWHVTGVPTIVRQKEGKEVGRLSDETEILEKLASFVKD
ncbi:hypothetical protein CPC08DRAFT_519164 [Agrocybe pediades]|nr:hypothetical protein CPC08DRAFT_519164 [Agrocybe pediades]